MDSRAKQRLTGAVILVALFVLLVPELLTGPKTASTPPIDEQGEHRVVFNVEPPKTANTETPAVEPPVNLAPPMAPATERAVPGEAAAREPVEPLAAAAEPEPKPVTPARTTTLPAEKPPVKPSTPTPSATAAASSPAKPAASRAEPRSFVVQLGSFGIRDNAERLVREMKAKGYTTFITPTTTNGRQLYQVRVGPTRDRDSAEALAARLKREGQSGSIVPIP